MLWLLLGILPWYIIIMTGSQSITSAITRFTNAMAHTRVYRCGGVGGTGGPGLQCWEANREWQKGSVVLGTGRVGLELGPLYMVYIGWGVPCKMTFVLGPATALSSPAAVFRCSSTPIFQIRYIPLPSSGPSSGNSSYPTVKRLAAIHHWAGYGAIITVQGEHNVLLYYNCWYCNNRP